MRPWRWRIGTVLAILAVLGGTVALVGVAWAHRSASGEVTVVSLPARSAGLIVDGQTGRAFIGGPDGRLQVRDSATGAFIRSVDLAPVPSANFLRDLAITDRALRIVVIAAPHATATSETLSLLDARSGRVLNTTVLPAGSLSDPIAYAPRTNRVFALSSLPFLSGHIRVTVVDAATGQLVGIVTLREPASVGPYAFTVDPHAGCVILTNLALGTVSALDGTSGQVRWTRQVVWHGGSIPLAASMAVIDDRTGDVYVADLTTGTVGAYDLASGQSRWTAALAVPGAARLLVSARTGRVFAIQSGRAVALDARSGRTVARIPLAGMASSGGLFQDADHLHDLSLIVDNRRARVLIADPASKTLHALDGTSGRVAYMVALPSDMAREPVVPDSSGEHLIVATERLPGADVSAQPSGVVVLSDSDGTLLRRLPVGGRPDEVVLDDRTGRLLMLSASGRIDAADPWAWMPPLVRRFLPLATPTPRTQPTLSIVEAERRTL